LDNAKISLEEAQLNLAYADVTAPIAGVVTQRLVEVGDLVRGNQEVFVVADLHPLLVKIFAPEQRMYQLHPGQEATIAVEALPDTSFSGRIRMISPEVDPASGTVKVTLEVASAGVLKPGMFATVRIITERRPQTLVVPKKALILETDEDDVFLIEADKVRRVSVELGFVEGDQVEIVSGLKEGDQVVTIGHEGLKDGAAVRLAGEGLTVPAELASPPGEGSRPPEARGGLPDSLRQVIAEYRRAGKPLPDSLRQRLRALREQGGGRPPRRGQGRGE
jgi:membrane fusion protein (multidrug efflux system)